ncbi:MAG: hypothetical protein HYY13_10590 [Nitrospirae bacterium]|nr:hypothetical protein [Nitrospirota bacterium]
MPSLLVKQFVPCRQWLGLSVALVSLLSLAGPAHAGSVSIRVSVSADDAEEDTGTGAVNRTSSDLELTTDGGVVQQVGMRFLNVTVPKAAVITNAYVEFETDETGSSSTNLTFNGHAADNAAVFTSTNYDISSRTKTTATVTWSSVPAWTPWTRNTSRRTCPRSSRKS